MTEEKKDRTREKNLSVYLLSVNQYEFMEYNILKADTFTLNFR